MEKGKHRKKRFEIIEVYSVLILIATLFMSIGYAKISDILLGINGEVQATAQEGVFIKNIVSENAGTAISKVNYYIETVLDSEIDLGNDSNSTITYQVTLYNNSNKESLYIGTITDKIDENINNNDNIEIVVNGLQEYETIIPANGTLNFSLTFRYKDKENITNTLLKSRLNFRFKLIPKLVLSSESDIYELNNIYPDYIPQEGQIYQFTVSNYDENETNYVPMEYSFETIIDAPLTVKIYDKEGKEVTESISILGDGSTQEDHTYTLKVLWDNSNPEENIDYNNLEYSNQEFNGLIKLKAIPKDEKYLKYFIEKEFSIAATSDLFYFESEATNTEIEFDGNEAEIDLVVKNNDGTNYNKFDTEYEISVEGNENFIILSDNTGLLEGNSLIDENLKIKIGLKENADINSTENITIKVKTITPYIKEISIPITVNTMPGNLEVAIDTTSGTFENSSSKTSHKITVINNNSMPITFRVTGNSTSALNLSGANKDIVVAGKSQTETTITISPVQDYTYIGEQKSININVNVVDPYQLDLNNYTIVINTHGSPMSDIITEKHPVSTTTPTFTENVTTAESSGLFEITDPSGTGTARYFRGVVTNNYVSFANKLWRIMRINKDGTVRLILDSPINSSTTYKYTSSTTNTVYNNSLIESTLETWYGSNLLSYNSYINQNAVFIHDRRTYSSSVTNVFRGWYRLMNDSPSIDITEINAADLYGSAAGNGYLTYPIGLATSDELMLAGAVIPSGSTTSTPNSSSANLKPNTAYYIANDVPSGVGLWLMTPFSPTAVMCFKSQVGFYKETPTSARLLKPVIELKANLTYTGTGVKDDPYIIDE